MAAEDGSRVVTAEQRRGQRAESRAVPLKKRKRKALADLRVAGRVNRSARPVSRFSFRSFSLFEVRCVGREFRNLLRCSIRTTFDCLFIQIGFGYSLASKLRVSTSTDAAKMVKYSQ
jgi:hypothetical protein